MRHIAPIWEDPGRVPPSKAQAESPTAAASNPLVSDAAAEAIAASFARLAAMPRDIPPGDGNRTLEDTVRELLRPQLQAWLDDNLPDLVERLVRAEIARVIGEAGPG